MFLFVLVCDVLRDCPMGSLSHDVGLLYHGQCVSSLTV